jgi:tetratricopeptide (TPR) repeat protein
VIAGASSAAEAIRQIEGGAVSNEVSQLVSLLNAGKNDGLTFGQQLMQDHHRDSELMHLVGVAYSRLGKYAEAEPVLRRAAELAPDQVEIAASPARCSSDGAHKGREEQDAKARCEAEKWLGKAVAEMQPPATALLTNYSIALEGSAA